MARSESQQAGILFEAEAAAILGLRQTPNSGAGSDRSDASGALRLSCKASTDRIGWAEIKRHVAEAVDLAYGTGETPALALQDHVGEQYLILRLSDAGEFMAKAGDVERPRRVGRGERIAAIAEVPAMLRGMDS